MRQYLTPAFVLVATLLGGCGTKGPLTLPPKPGTPAVTPAQAAPATKPTDLNTASQAPR